MAQHRDLTALFDPRSVAVVGASDDTAKWGYGLSRQLLSAGASRPVHLVNRRGGTVLGRPTLTRLTDVDGTVDLVAICVPAAGFVEAVRDALTVGARVIVGITAGLSESGPAGRAIEDEALALVRAAGAALVGPNCLGVADTTTGLLLTSDPFHGGHVAVLSQSGNLVLDLDDLLYRSGMGVSRFVSLGNQSDVTLAELIRTCAAHEGTRAIAVYAEDLRDGRDLVAAAREAYDAGRPVVLLAPGRSAAASRGAASHTGAMTSPTRVVDAVCAAGGIHRVDTPTGLAGLLQGLVAPRRSRGRRVAILTDGGGHGAIAADAVSAAGLEVPELGGALGVRLRAALWESSPVANPVDLAGVGEQDPDSYVRGTAELLASDEVDAVLMTGYFGGYALDPDTSLGVRETAAAHDLVALVAEQDKPVVVHSIYPHSPSVEVLADGGLPVHRDVAAAAAGLAGLVETSFPRDDLDLPPADPPLTDPRYTVIRAALSDHGIPFPASRTVSSSEDLDGAATELGFPLVLKADGLLHKSDVGGVVLGIPDRPALRAAYDDLLARLSPPAICVERMATMPDGVEVIVGVHRDPRCGPVVMVGLGGVLTEVIGDVAFALAPVGHETAHRLLESLHGAQVLRGVRGRRPVDRGALADLVVRVADYAVRHPELAELEVNPVLAGPDGAVALDARAVFDVDP